MPSNSTPAVGQRDIDTILEDIEPPVDLLAALKPVASCTVANFLLIHVPPRPGSRKYFLEAFGPRRKRRLTRYLSCVMQ
jgi:hypothetical protein